MMLEFSHHGRRVGTLVTSCLYTTLFAGAYFGWGPFQLLLEQNGNFHSKCSSEDVCSEQKAALLRIPSISQAIALGLSPVFGWIADRGSKYVVYVMTFCFIGGLGLILVAAQLLMDFLVLPGFMLFAMGAVCGSNLTVQSGMIFVGETRSRIIFVLNNLYDAGAITPLLLWYLTQWIPSLTMTAIFGGYIILAVLILAPACLFWSTVTPIDQITDSENDVEYAKDECVAQETEDTSYIKDTSETPEKPPTDNIIEETNLSDKKEDIEGARDHDETEIKTSSDQEENPVVCVYTSISQRPSSEQLLSRPFILLCIYFGIQIATNLWTLATARDFLAYLGDDEFNNRYLTIFILLTPASIIGVPFVDYVVRNYGYHGGMQTINVLSISQGIVKVASSNLNVQILGFVLFSFFRSFLFAVVFAFVPTFLGSKTVGKGIGILTFSSIITFINAPISNVVVTKLDGNFFWPNLAYTLLGIPCIGVAWFIERDMKIDRAARKQNQT